MIQSMTGYGSESIETEIGKIQIDLKSLNSKSIDINLILGSNFKAYENDFRVQISKLINRGKIDLKLIEDVNQNNVSHKINPKVIKHYIKDLKKISSASDNELLKIAVKLPDSISVVEIKHSEMLKKKIFKCLYNAIKKLINFRVSEGLALKNDIIINIETIKKNLIKVQQLAPNRTKKIKDKFIKSMNKLNHEFSKDRMEQEIIYYIEKLDLNEEIIRLKNHIVFFNKTLKNKSDVKGKKLMFIAQEIGREINTIGSKANNSNIQQRVVEMKSALEKIKEQLLNVL